MKSRHWLWLLLLIPIGLGLVRLRLDVAVMDLLPGKEPVVEGLKIYQRYFTDAHQLVISVSNSTPDQTEATVRRIADALAEKKELVTMVIWQQPEELMGGSGGDEALAARASELIAYSWLNQSPEAVRNLTERLAPTNLDRVLTTVREQLATSFSVSSLMRTRDPYELLPWKPENSAQAPKSFQLASPDGTFRIMFVQATTDLLNYRECQDWIDQIKTVVQASGVNPSAVIHYTGRPAFEAEIAGDMRRDIIVSVFGTSGIIAILFFIAHRRIVPMLWLLTLLSLILVATLAFGALIFGTINVVSIGFAAILLGLAVDYAVVHYQEALAKPEETIPEVRRAIAPSIFWAAVTTISAFLVLNFSGLPGLGQLGSLVAIGVALSALVMLFGFLPPLFRHRMKRIGDHRPPISLMLRAPVEHEITAPLPKARARLVFAVSGCLILFVLAALATGIPALDHTADALRPRHSPSYTAVEEIKHELGRNGDPLWVITSGTNELDVLQKLHHVTAALDTAKSNGLVRDFTLPTPLWPNPTNQAANKLILKELVAEEPLLTSAAASNGFATNALLMTSQILATWRAAIATPGVFWPTNEMSQWVLGQFAARRTNLFMATGLIYPATESLKQLRHEVARWEPSLPRDGVLLSGWPLLGSALVAKIQQNVWHVVLPMVVLVLLSLWFAFRRPREILLSLGVMLISGLFLLAVMRASGWSWNLLNMMAVPLILGTGVDYSIFMQLALRRHDGDLKMAHQSVGRALLLCGGTAVAGFGSLSLSTNAGMASLGQVCAIGIGCNMLISVYLLPIWWRIFSRR